MLLTIASKRWICIFTIHFLQVLLLHHLHRRQENNNKEKVEIIIKKNNSSNNNENPVRNCSIYILMTLQLWRKIKLRSVCKYEKLAGLPDSRGKKTPENGES